ncbi:MAG: phenylalanine--tRNA ligase subunit alpha [Desulfuromonadales bacterium C00003096]|jgi:phenylalanyl-tRNA synthetase alpha chain|nr:MAG: phenylalanine--tRNA ligase subunit alpha [Desulfuromonadales bacterium C00003096]
MQLTPNEKRVLSALNDLKRSPPAELAAKSDLNPDALMQSAYLLEEKGLSEIQESLTEIYTISEEGKEYARVGLPERQILSHVQACSEEVTISDLKTRFPPAIVGISMGWLRRKGWGAIADGVVVPVGAAAPDTGADEDALRILLEEGVLTESAHEKAVNDLIKRKLVNVTEKKLRTIVITEKGEKLSREIPQVEETEEIVQLTSDIIRSRKWDNIRAYDIHATVPRTYPVKIHPYQRLIDQMRRILLEMGFTEIKGDVVQSSFWNFDALFQPQDHPAREMQDTFYLNSEAELPEGYEKVRDVHEFGGETGSTGWGGEWSEELSRKEVLRTHTTAITIRYLAEHSAPPKKAFCIDRVYRREAIDPTHTPEFEQLEGVVMDPGVSFANLLGYLVEFYHHIGFKDVRFRPGYFPYTEPSVEAEVYVDSLGWVELGGAGIFREEVTAPLGIECPVLAWGLGVSRVAMLRLGLRDLRKLYQSDIDWLRESPVGA